MSGIAKLAAHLTEANRKTLLGRAAGQSKRKIEELVAELSPKPDVPAAIRKLPERREKANSTPALQLRPDGVVKPNPAPPPAKPPVVEPSAPARYRVRHKARAPSRAHRDEGGLG